MTHRVNVLHLTQNDTRQILFFIVNVTSLPISKSVMGKFMTMFTLSQSGADQRNKARQFVIIRFTCTLVNKILVSSYKYAYFITSMAYNNFIKLSESLKYTLQ